MPFLMKTHLMLIGHYSYRDELTVFHFQAVNFSDTQEYLDLEACLDEVKTRLQSHSVLS